MRPRLADLCSGAGGAAMGYQRAGFEVVGFDLAPQPRYPFEFHQADALEVDLSGFDAVHASVPCQWATAYRRRGGGVGDGCRNLIPAMREKLRAAGLPYLIENVESARPHLIDPVRLCGTAFGPDLQRHRLFECSFPAAGTSCDHGRNTPRWPPATNRRNKRKTIEIGVWRIPLAEQQRAMHIPWMTLPELTEAIPPPYTEHLGAQLRAHLSDLA